MRKKRNYCLLLFVLLIADIVTLGFFAIKQVKTVIPDKIYVRTGQNEGVRELIGNPLVTCPDTIRVSENGNYKIQCSFLGIIPLKEVEVQTKAEKTVSVCAVPIGLYMETDGVLVVDTGEITGSDGSHRNPAANIARAGDYILKVNGIAVTGKKELIRQIKSSNGDTMELLVNRRGEEIPIRLTPVLAEDQNYKLGIWVRDNTQGIGTMTYVDKSGKFGALGHGISDTDTGELLEIENGELYEARILSIVKGMSGNPCELSAY